MLRSAPFDEKTVKLLLLASLGRWCLSVLLVLDEGNMKNIEIRKRLNERSKGQILLSQSSMDFALRDLSDAGLVKRVRYGSGYRMRYMNSLTKKGREELNSLNALGLLV